MSTAIFPTLLGLGWSVQRKPMWSTQIQTNVSGKEARQARWTYPRYEWTLKFDFLRQTPTNQDLASLLGFFNARQGQFDSFLYQDAADYQAVAQQFGTGNGSQTIWQLVRTFGGFVEPVLAPKNDGSLLIPGPVTVAGTPTVAYNVSSWGADGSLNAGATQGQIRFNSAPANGAALIATFDFYWGCRFVDPEITFENFMHQLWAADGVKFISLK